MIEATQNGFESGNLSSKSFDDVRKWDETFFRDVNGMISEMQGLFHKTQNIERSEEEIMFLIGLIENDVDTVISEVKLAKQKHLLTHGLFKRAEKKDINIYFYNQMSALVDKIEREVKKVNLLISQLDDSLMQKKDSRNKVVISLNYLDKIVPVIKRLITP